MNNYNLYLSKLEKSKFRSSFHLKQNDKTYVIDKGINTIRNHTIDFITKRLAPEFIPNDGKQTPMRGHPTFIAQHATATCCRKCLYKWYKIEKNKKLSSSEISFITDLIILWIEKEIKN